jgi:hypothetical protein
MIITYTVNKDYFQTTTILPFLAAKITNKQIPFARPDNTKDGPGQVYQEIYVFPRCRLRSIISPLQIGKAEFGSSSGGGGSSGGGSSIGSSDSILVHFFVAFPTTTTINYLDIFTPK